MNIKNIIQLTGLNIMSVAKTYIGYRVNPTTHRAVTEACLQLKIPVPPENEKGVLLNTDIDPITVAKVLLGDPVRSDSYHRVVTLAKATGVTLPPHSSSTRAATYEAVALATNLPKSVIAAALMGKACPKAAYDRISEICRTQGLPEPPPHQYDAIQEIAHYSGLGKSCVRNVMSGMHTQQRTYDMVSKACVALGLESPPERKNSKADFTFPLEKEIHIHELFHQGLPPGEIARQAKVSGARVDRVLEERMIGRFLHVTKLWIMDRGYWRLEDDSGLPKFIHDSFPEEMRPTLQPEIIRRIVDIFVQYGWITTHPITLTDDGERWRYSCVLTNRRVRR